MFNLSEFLLYFKYKFVKILKNKKLAKRYKSIEQEKLLTQKVKSLKWGCSYSVFDGIELLERSIKTVRKNCDYINVVYSDISWYGVKTKENILKFLEDLKDKGLIDEIIYFEPNLKLLPVQNEINKRNLGLKFAKKAKVQYFMTMDIDEFYLTNELEIAKRYIIHNNITHSFCNIVNYAVLPTKRYKKTPSYVQIFSKINKKSILKINKKIITIVDPTRQLSHFCNAKYFFLPQVEMHHMTSIRKDLLKKIKNSSFTSHYEQVNSISKYIENSLENTISTQDLFNLTDLATEYLKGQYSERI